MVIADAGPAETRIEPAGTNAPAPGKTQVGIQRVVCASCSGTWIGISTTCVYEREALESRPCPSCGAYTLSATVTISHPVKRHRSQSMHGQRKAG